MKAGQRFAALCSCQSQVSFNEELKDNHTIEGDLAVIPVSFNEELKGAVVTVSGSNSGVSFNEELKVKELLFLVLMPFLGIL